MAHPLISLILLVAAVQAAGQVATPPPAPRSQQADVSYTIGPRDVLTITVFNEPDLSGKFTVDSDGAIAYPFIQRLMVQGKTTRDVEAELTKRLQPDYVRRAQVTVDIAQFRERKIFVLGEVRTPGTYTLEGQVTLLELLSRAGSLTSTAGPTIRVIRFKEGQPAPSTEAPLPGDKRAADIMQVNIDDLRNGRVAASLLLQDGDTIFVPQADRFYVTGFVKSPGQFVLVPNMTVQQAIALAGGLTERGSDRRLELLRRVNNKEVVIKAKMTDIVQPNDTIRVKQRLI